MKEQIIILKDISGLPHAISLNELYEALQKRKYTLFDLSIEEIGQLRQERDEAVARLEQIKLILEHETETATKQIELILGDK